MAEFMLYCGNKGFGYVIPARLRALVEIKQGRVCMFATRMRGLIMSVSTQGLSMRRSRALTRPLGDKQTNIYIARFIAVRRCLGSCPDPKPGLLLEDPNFQRYDDTLVGVEDNSEPIRDSRSWKRG